MLWRTHIRIAYKILDRLGIPKSSPEAASLREGIITPDKWKDFPHHHDKESDIEEHIMKARGFFLDNDLEKACFHLGVALHYVQDSYTSLSTRSEHHTRWEEQMDEAYFVDNLHRLVEKTFYDRPDRREEYSERADMLSEKTEGKEATLQLATMPGPGLSFWSYREWGKPHVDVNFALKASYLISESVFGPKSCTKLKEELKSIQQEYQSNLKEAEISLANSIVESVRKRCELENRRRKNGFLQTIRNGFWKGLAKRHRFQARRKMARYKQQKHLKEVLEEYNRTIDKVVMPHRYWYLYTIPKIQRNVVDKELLSIEEASKRLGVEESTVLDLIKSNRIACYQVKDDEFLLKSELAKHSSE